MRLIGFCGLPVGRLSAVRDPEGGTGYRDRDSLGDGSYPETFLDIGPRLGLRDRWQVGKGLGIVVKLKDVRVEIGGLVLRATADARLGCGRGGVRHGEMVARNRADGLFLGVAR
jgi:hypothetical protein